MKAGKWIAYYRVSTAKQGTSGLGLEAQSATVQAYVASAGGTIVAELTEVESGKLSDRAHLGEALRLCRLTGSTLVIAKLDRLSRNVAFLSALMESGVPFVACDNPHANKFTLHILAAVAEHEAEMISTRTKAALAAARARGTVLGGFRGVLPPDPAKAAEGRARKANDFAASVLPDVMAMQAQGMSLRAMAAELTRRQITTPNGGEWTATGVRRVLARL